MSSIPSSLFNSVIPSVLGAGGEAIDINGLVLTTSNRVPIGAVYSFSGGAAVTTFFGSGSNESTVANGGVGKGSGYFGGFTNADALPGTIMFAQYNRTAVAAYLWGGNAAAALTLAQLQALSGSLTIVMDGYPHVISSISLSSYSSFSAAAAGIAAAFTDPTEASFTASLGATFTGTQSGTNLTTTSVTGLISPGDAVIGTGVAANTTIVSQTSGASGGAGVYVTSLSGTASSASCTSSSTVLDVTAVGSGSIAAGQTVVGSFVTGAPVITAQLTGSAGAAGTYTVSGAQQSVASEAMTAIATAPLVTFDSVSGAFVITSGATGTPSTAAFATGTLAAPLLLTSATGAVLSQGAAAATPAAFMGALIQTTTNFATFMTAFDPDSGSGSAQKQAFAAWNAGQNNQFCYVCFDTDASPRAAVPASSSLGFVLQNNGNSGTCLISELSDLNLAAFVCGAAAAIDFEETAGHISFAYKNQPGLVADVTTSTAAVNLGGNPQVAGSFGNGYNYFGAVASSNQNFLWFQRGTVTGPFVWLDTYIEQIWLNRSFQSALNNLQNNAKSIPYSFAGDSLLESALAAPIAAGLNFGAFGPGALSASQVQEVNGAAGANISSTLQTQGYYLQILPANAATRNARTSPPAKFWYITQGSVQAISLASIALL